MYKLWHKLFGWDYVAWKNSADQGIARVYKNDDGLCWYWRYRGIKVIDLITKERLNATHYGSPVVLFLTCPSSKYIKE